jgi:hypothetical protein
VLLWLLSGFLAAYLGWRFHDKRSFDVTIGGAITMSVLGGVSLLACLLYCLNYANLNFMDKVVFKKEEK